MASQNILLYFGEACALLVALPCLQSLLMLVAASTGQHDVPDTYCTWYVPIIINKEIRKAGRYLQSNVINAGII